MTNEIIYLVACDYHGNILKENIFAYPDLFKQERFIDILTNCTGVMVHSQVETTSYLSYAALICRDIVSVESGDKLSSLVEEFDAKSVGRVVVFLSQETYLYLAERGFIAKIYCVYPAIVDDMYTFQHFDVTDTFACGDWQCATLVRNESFMTDERINSAIDNLEKWMNSDDAKSDPYITDVVSSIENTFDENDSISADDISAILDSGEPPPEINDYARIQTVQKLADVLHDAVEHVNLLDDKMNSISDVVLRCKDAINSACNDANRLITEKTSEITTRDDMREKSIDDLRIQMGNVIYELNSINQSTSKVPIVISVIASVIAVASAVINFL